MNFFQQIVNQKINQISPTQLSQMAETYGITISAHEAELVINKVKQAKINIFDDVERANFLQEIAQITSPQVANQVEALFQQFTNH